MRNSFPFFLGLMLLMFYCNSDAASFAANEMASAADVVVVAKETEDAPNPALATHPECDNLPRPANAALKLVSSADDWYQVYEAGPGVFALVEPYQYQEAISYLILGNSRALLFDSGIGLVPIRPVVESLTKLPVEVLNSHTHFDHVGGNYEFDQVLAIDSAYTRANMAGFPHTELAGELAPEALCHGAPENADLDAYRVRPWAAARYVTDGEVLDLGDRQIEVLQVPGHTPDAVALLDRRHRLLWTGDSYYDGGLWLFVPETNLDSYQQSMTRLVDLAASVDFLLPAHNTARVDPSWMIPVVGVLEKIRSGEIDGTKESGNRLIFESDGITIVTAQQVLDGQHPDVSKGGSGLTTWPEL